MQNLQAFYPSIVILLAAVTGLFRYRIIEPNYYPFVWVCWLLTANETVRFVLLNLGIDNMASYNIALPISLALYLWLFKNWGLFINKPYRMAIWLSLMMLIWIADHFIINGYRLLKYTHYFRISYSALLVFLSVISINRQIVSEKKVLLRSARFIICMTLIVYYTYRVLVVAFNLSNFSDNFLKSIGDFNRYLLIGFNLLFFIAALWIPKKKNFTVQL